MPSLRVFISYSWDSEEHKQRVLHVAHWLRARGIDAWLDEFETSPDEGWPQWCYNQIEQADHVLAVCTERYVEKVMRKQTAGTGRGGTWEGAIITSALYNNTAGSDKFIPVVFSPADAQAHIPFFLHGWSIYDVSDEPGLGDLYRHLTDQPAVDPGPLGQIVAMPPEELAQPQPLGPALTAQTNLAGVIEGTWVVEVMTPQGRLLSQLNLAKNFLGTQIFESVGIISAPGWRANGEWQIIAPGSRVMLGGTQMSMPFGMQPLQEIFEFHTISPTLLEGTAGPMRMPVRWTRP